MVAYCDATTFCNLASQMCTPHKAGGSGTNIFYKTSQTYVQNNRFGMQFAGLQEKRSDIRSQGNLHYGLKVTYVTVSITITGA